MFVLTDSLTLGKPGLEGSFKHPETTSVLQMEFIANKVRKGGWQGGREGEGEGGRKKGGRQGGREGEGEGEGKGEGGRKKGGRQGGREREGGGKEAGRGEEVGRRRNEGGKR